MKVYIALLLTLAVASSALRTNSQLSLMAASAPAESSEESSGKSLKPAIVQGASACECEQKAQDCACAQQQQTTTDACGCTTCPCEKKEYVEPHLKGNEDHVKPEIVDKPSCGSDDNPCTDPNQGVTVLKASSKDGDSSTVLKPGFLEVEDCGCCGEQTCECCPKKEYVSPEIKEEPKCGCDTCPCAQKTEAEEKPSCGCDSCPCEKKAEFVKPEVKESCDSGNNCPTEQTTVLKPSSNSDASTVLKPSFLEVEDCGCCGEQTCECCPKKEYVSPEIKEEPKCGCDTCPCAQKTEAEEKPSCGCDSCPCEKKAEFVKPEVKESCDSGNNCPTEQTTVLKPSSNSDASTVLKPGFLEVEDCGCCGEQTCECCPKKEFVKPELKQECGDSPCEAKKTEESSTVVSCNCCHVETCSCECPKKEFVSPEIKEDKCGCSEGSECPSVCKKETVQPELKEKNACGEEEQCENPNAGVTVLKASSNKDASTVLKPGF